ncbi:hypothetical protein [Lentzea sp. NBRC 102530]|uniref:hypothetical protein n=1 Tax=Lentzea sp. NBRC 102530 TaxID=3032201 RepID=UPI0024A148B0|nr:hypothetical protein [Lentzea sp. NBRC 102530]GLY55185.1 hypothetical protein Lesp01_88400 [Lentzea sp. NBRC 102530]
MTQASEVEAPAAIRHPATGRVVDVVAVYSTGTGGVELRDLDGNRIDVDAAAEVEVVREVRPMVSWFGVLVGLADVLLVVVAVAVISSAWLS